MGLIAKNSGSDLWQNLKNCVMSAIIQYVCQEYPSDPLHKISALQTKVKLAGNRSNKQNLAENLANREIPSWKKILSTNIAYILVVQINSG